MRSWLDGWAAPALLSPSEWVQRHRWIARAAVAQAGALAMLAGALGRGRPTAFLILVVVGLPAVLSLRSAWPARVRTVLASASLVLGGMVMLPVTQSDKAFTWIMLMIAVCSLYQDWIVVPVVLTVLTVHVVAVLGGPDGFRPLDLLPLTATLLLGAVHHLILRLADDRARTDPLTGLGNRRQLSEVTARLLRREAPLSVLFLDLDDFKAVNDSRGHAFGDALLVEVAARLRAGVRGDDLVVRLGGDEFAILVPGDPVHAADVARRVQAAMRVPVQLTGRAVSVAVSVGVATSATAARRDAEELLRNADVAMYRAKDAGRNRAVTFTPGMVEAACDRAALAEDLTVALAAGDQLSVHYQPVVTLPGGEVSGYEALLRWRHPTRGPIPPLQFIPVAEQTGTILALGAWVLGQAARDAVAGLGGTAVPSKVAVNVSAVQLADEGFVEVVATALRDSGLPADRLVVEVTESVLAADLETVSARLQAIRDLGVKIAIDDFGTGYSSLSYLRQLPADIVKIDRSFVTDLARGGSATTLVASIVELARSLHLDVVAEGVETVGQVAVLSQLGCTYAQGYLFGRPAPVVRAELPATPTPVELPA